MTDQEKSVIEVRVKNALNQIRPKCPHAMQTLKQGIETSLKRVIPEVKSVEKI